MKMHASEAELQEYAAGNTHLLNEEICLHIENCINCQTQVNEQNEIGTYLANLQPQHLEKNIAEEVIKAAKPNSLLSAGKTYGLLAGLFLLFLYTVRATEKSGDLPLVLAKLAKILKNISATTTIFGQDLVDIFTFSPLPFSSDKVFQWLNMQQTTTFFTGLTVLVAYAVLDRLLRKHFFHNR